MRNLKAKIYKCRNCGAEVEMFSDELRTRCKSCRQFIFKEQLPYCIQGCMDVALSRRVHAAGPAVLEINNIADISHELEVRSG